MSQAASDGSAGRLPPGRLTLTVEDSGPDLVLRMAGDLDLTGIGQVMAALDRLEVGRTAQLIFDLRELAFLDLAGLTTILRANDYCKDRHIAVTVIKPRGLASRVFTLTSAHRELDLVDSRVPGPAHETQDHESSTLGSTAARAHGVARAALPGPGPAPA